MSISVIIFGEKTTLNHEIKAVSSFLADAFTEKQLLKEDRFLHFYTRNNNFLKRLMLRKI